MLEKLSLFITPPSLELIDKKEFIYYSTVLGSFVPKYILRDLHMFHNIKNKEKRMVQKPQHKSASKVTSKPPIQRPMTPPQNNHSEIIISNNVDSNDPKMVDEDHIENVRDDEIFAKPIRSKKKAKTSHIQDNSPRNDGIISTMDLDYNE